MSPASLLLSGLLTASPAARAAGPDTPIKRLVVVFQENVSFDHYFGTYPRAENRPGETAFKPLPGTPTVNGLTGPLLARNPNAAAPIRLDRARAATCDMDHTYAAEQKAVHGGLMDRFVESTGNGDKPCDARMVMAFFDGNTVTALWNYAQHFAMSDDFFGTTFGPSTPGALNLVSGQTHGAVPPDLSGFGERLSAGGTMVGDPDPEFDDCSGAVVARMEGRNVGHLLTAHGVSWGWFEGGFRPSARGGDGKASCRTAHKGADGKEAADYIPHHEPFQYYKATANPHHLPPASVDEVGHDGPANHQYDLQDFWEAAEAGKTPSVSFLKAPAYQDGHAGYSDPVSEQAFLVETLNRLQKLPAWKDTAVLIAYDDSDGWYDHVMPPIVNHSAHPDVDALVGPGSCGTPAPGAYPGRCGYGPRLPLLAVSPYARANYVDHAALDQTSILRFIEDNWSLGRLGDQSFDELAGSLEGLFDFARPRKDRLFLDAASGQPKGS